MIARKILLLLGLCLALVASASEPSQSTTPSDLQQLQQQIQALDKELTVLKEVTASRLDSQDKRVGDLGLWTSQQANHMGAISHLSSLVGLGITIITVAVGLLTFLSTRSRARKEAKAASASWFEEKSTELIQEIENLRQQALGAQKEVDDHITQTKQGVNKAAADATKELSELVAKAAQQSIFSSDPSAQTRPSPEAVQTVQDASQALGAKPENDFTAEDHFVRGLNEFNAKRFDSALISFEKAIDKADTVPVTAVRNAEFIFARAITLDMLGRTEEAVQLYDQIQQRYDKDTSPDLRDSVARALVNKSVALGKLGRRDEAIQLSEQIAQIYGNDDDPQLREQTARALGNKGFTLAELGKKQEAIQTLEQIVKRYADDPEPAIQRVVANTQQLLNELRGDSEPEAEPA